MSNLQNNTSNNTTKPKRQLSEVAECAKLIRKDLKTMLPDGVVFEVTSKNYSGGDSIDVKIISDDLNIDVSNIKIKLSKYQYGNFDGMNDLYTINNKKNFPQTKHLFIKRKLSNKIMNKITSN